MMWQCQTLNAAKSRPYFFICVVSRMIFCFYIYPWILQMNFIIYVYMLFLCHLSYVTELDSYFWFISREWQTCVIFFWTILWLWPSYSSSARLNNKANPSYGVFSYASSGYCATNFSLVVARIFYWLISDMLGSKRCPQRSWCWQLTTYCTNCDPYLHLCGSFT